MTVKMILKLFTTELNEGHEKDFVVAKELDEKRGLPQRVRGT